MSQHYKLIYFPVRGRAEFIRYLLAQAGVEYDEQTVKFDEWPKMKPSMPMGQLPVLEFDGRQLCQSTSIARYIAHKYGLDGKNEWDVAYADMLSQCVEDLYPSFRPFVMAIFANDEEKKAEEWTKYKDTTLKPSLEKFEKFLGDKKFFNGDYVTYVDLLVAELLDRVHTCFDKEVVGCYPKLKEHTERVHELPNVKKYIAKRPKYDL